MTWQQLLNALAPSTSEPSSRLLDADAPLFEPLLERPDKRGVVLEEAVDQVVVVTQRNELERRCTVDGDDDRFLMAKPSVAAQMRLGLSQRNDLHGVLETPLPGQ